jgi:hypothetical protein
MSLAPAIASNNAWIATAELNGDYLSLVDNFAISKLLSHLVFRHSRFRGGQKENQTAEH